MSKDRIIRLSMQLQDALNDAYLIAVDQRKVKRFLRDSTYAAPCNDTELRRIACEIATTYHLIRRYVVDVIFDDEFKVNIETTTNY